MTENRPDHMFVNNQRESGGYGYTVNEQQSYGQERDSTMYHMLVLVEIQLKLQMLQRTTRYNANLIDKEPISRGRVHNK